MILNIFCLSAYLPAQDLVYITMLNNWILGLILEIQLLGPWYLLYIYVFKFVKGQWTCIQPQLVQYSSVQLLSRVQFYNPIDCSTPVLLVHHQLPPSNHLILWHPLLLLPSIFPSIRVFSCESVLCIGWPKYWSFSFSISPSNEYSGLISFRMDWLDLLAVQGTLNSLLQHHSSKASVLQCSAFFIVQISHPYIIMGKKTFN